MSWSKITLGDVVEIKHGFAFRSEFFSDVGDYLLLTPGNCHESGGLKLKGDKEKFFTGNFPEEYLLSTGDLLNPLPVPERGLKTLLKHNDQALVDQSDRQRISSRSIGSSLNSLRE